MSRGTSHVRYRLGLAGAVAAIVLGLGAFWLGNLGAQCVMELMSPATGVVSGPMGLLAPRLASPLLGISADPWPLASGTLLALVVSVRAILASRVDDLEISADEQHGTQSLAKPRDWRRYAHVADSVRVGGRRVGWGRPPWCERLDDDNLLLADSARLALSDHPDRRWRPPNHHCFVIAGSGSGKTYNFVTSNALQLNASYVFTDPKGELFSRFARLLERHGYEVRLLDLRPDEGGIRASNGYNPLHYCRTCTAIDDVVERLVQATSSPEASGSANQEWFTNMEKLAYGSIWKMEYFWFAAHGDEGDYNIPSVYDWLQRLRMDGDAQSELDLAFFAKREEHGFSGYEEWVRMSHPTLSERDLSNLPEWEPINNYRGFTAMAGSPETLASVLASCYNRLRPIMNSAMREVLTRTDELELDQLGTRRQAIFMLTADSGGPYDFLASMLTSQLFAVNARVADDSPGHHLPIPVVCYLDEIANIGRLPNLDKLFATLRSRWINLVAITQYSGQLKVAYKEGARGIMANSSVLVYLGAGDLETCEQISKMLGTRTVHYTDRSVSRSATGTSVSESVRWVEQPIYSAAELFNVTRDSNRCLVHLMNDRWLEGAKPDPRAHPRWTELQEAGEVTDFVAWSREWHERRDRELAARPTREWVDGDGIRHLSIGALDRGTCVIDLTDDSDD